MTINDGLGGGVTRLRYDIIYEQIHLKKTAKSSINGRMFFKLGTFATFLIASMAIAGTTGWCWWWVFCLKVRYAIALVGLGCDQYPSTYYVI